MTGRSSKYKKYKALKSQEGRRLQATFLAARDLVGEHCPVVYQYGFVLGCPMVERANQDADRNLMHVMHEPNMICVAHAALKQNRRNLLGLWLHEFGHVIGGPTQYDADSAIWELLGIPIQYDRDMIEFVEL